MFVKDIVEHDTEKPRAPGEGSEPPRPPVPQARGFPVAAHRSKGGSAFARKRQDERTRAAGGLATGEGRVVEQVPSVGPSAATAATPKTEPIDTEVPSGLPEAETVRRQVDAENAARVQGMSPAEREQEASELRERFGPGVMDLMRKRRAAREAQPSVPPAWPSQSHDPDEQDATGSTDAAAILAGVDAENRRKVENMTNAERQTEVRELEERFGASLLERLRKRAEQSSAKAADVKSEPKPDAKSVRWDDNIAETKPHSKPLHPRPTDDDRAAKSPKPTPKLPSVPAPTPEQLKAYFPHVAVENDKLEWMTGGGQAPGADEDPNAPRFDLNGAPLSAAAAAALPTHLGLHHHGASPDLAGYTLAEIIHLCYSTVASQRVAMMGVLGRVVQRYRRTVAAERKASATTEPAGESAKKEPELTATPKEETATTAEENPAPVHSTAPSEVSATTPETEPWIAACKDLDIEAKAVSIGASVLSSPTRAVSVVAAAVDLLFVALGGPWPQLDRDEFGEDLRFMPEPLVDGEPAGVAALPWDELAPRLAELLSTELPTATRSQLLRILRRTAVASPQLAEAVTPIVPHSTKALVLRPAWPASDPDAGPDVDALALLAETIESAREAAEALVPTAHGLLKFLATGVPEDAAGRALVTRVLEILYALGRYGFGAGAATSAREVWSRLGTWVTAQCEDTAAPDTSAAAVVVAYFDLLRVWTVCAIDPHRTTPEHDLTWSQASGLGWNDEAVGAIRSLLPQKGRARELAAALQLLADYILGAGINGVRGGEEEKAALLAALRDMDVARVLPEAAKARDDRGFAAAAASVLRLHGLLGNKLLSRDAIVAFVTGPEPAAFSMGDLYLEHVSLLAARADGVLDLAQWAEHTFRLARLYMPGDEPLALALVDDLLRADWSALASAKWDARAVKLVAGVVRAATTVGHKDGLQILRPLLHATILPALSGILGPRRPAHLYLKATGTLRGAPRDAATTQGLPLPPDWTFSPINELLSSGSSEALALAPPDWDAAEPQIARASLALTRLAHLTIGVDDESYTLLGCMKVFMLEHGQQDTPNAVSDVFRDEGVHSSLVALLDGMSGSAGAREAATQSLEARMASHSLQAPGAHPPPLEVVSRRFLRDTPFFQFYQDLVALFEAVSFADTAFARVLVPPLAMAYPVDYRRVIWAESNALRSMRIADNDVPLEYGTLGVFFHPHEDDRGVLSAYARALVTRTVSNETSPFLARVAVHHLAALFWLSTDTDRTSTRLQLLVVVLSQARDDVLARLLTHDCASPTGDGTVPADTVQARVDTVASLGGQRAIARLTAAGYTPATPNPSSTTTQPTENVEE